MNKDRILQINKKSFITVCLILFIFMLLSYIMTFVIPHGIFEIINNENIYTEIEGNGIPFWKF